MISVASGAIAMVITKLGWIMEPWIWMSIFTGSALFSTIYSYILMPETQGLSLEEIKQLYKPIHNKVNLLIIKWKQYFFYFCVKSFSLQRTKSEPFSEDRAPFSDLCQTTAWWF